MKHSLIVVAAVSAIVGGGVVYSGSQTRGFKENQQLRKKLMSQGKQP